MKITLDLKPDVENQVWCLRIDGGNWETLSTSEVYQTITAHVKATMDSTLATK